MRTLGIRLLGSSVMPESDLVARKNDEEGVEILTLKHPPVTP